jgi:hypothetical protein
MTFCFVLSISLSFSLSLSLSLSLSINHSHTRSPYPSTFRLVLTNLFVMAQYTQQYESVLKQIVGSYNRESNGMSGNHGMSTLMPSSRQVPFANAGHQFANAGQPFYQSGQQHEQFGPAGQTLSASQLNKRVLIKTESVKMVRETVAMDGTFNACLGFLENRITEQGLHFYFHNKNLQPAVRNALETELLDFSKQFFRSYMTTGFVIVELSEHPVLKQIPRVIDATTVDTYLVTDQRGQRYYAVRDRTVSSGGEGGDQPTATVNPAGGADSQHQQQNPQNPQQAQAGNAGGFRLPGGSIPSGDFGFGSGPGADGGVGIGGGFDDPIASIFNADPWNQGTGGSGGGGPASIPLRMHAYGNPSYQGPGGFQSFAAAAPSNQAPMGHFTLGHGAHPITNEGQPWLAQTPDKISSDKIAALLQTTNGAQMFGLHRAQDRQVASLLAAQLHRQNPLHPPAGGDRTSPQHGGRSVLTKEQRRLMESGCSGTTPGTRARPNPLAPASRRQRQIMENWAPGRLLRDAIVYDPYPPTATGDLTSIAAQLLPELFRFKKIEALFMAASTTRAVPSVFLSTTPPPVPDPDEIKRADDLKEKMLTTQRIRENATAETRGSHQSSHSARNPQRQTASFPGADDELRRVYVMDENRGVQPRFLPFAIGERQGKILTYEAKAPDIVMARSLLIDQISEFCHVKRELWAGQNTQYKPNDTQQTASVRSTVIAHGQRLEKVLNRLSMEVYGTIFLSNDHLSIRSYLHEMANGQSASSAGQATDSVAIMLIPDEQLGITAAVISEITFQLAVFYKLTRCLPEHFLRQALRNQSQLIETLLTQPLPFELKDDGNGGSGSTTNPQPPPKKTKETSNLPVPPSQPSTNNILKTQPKTKNTTRGENNPKRSRFTLSAPDPVEAGKTSSVGQTDVSKPKTKNTNGVFTKKAMHLSTETVLCGDNPSRTKAPPSSVLPEKARPIYVSEEEIKPPLQRMLKLVLGDLRQRRREQAVARLHVQHWAQDNVPDASTKPQWGEEYNLDGKESKSNLIITIELGSMQHARNMQRVSVVCCVVCMCDGEKGRGGWFLFCFVYSLFCFHALHISFFLSASCAATRNRSV